MLQFRSRPHLRHRIERKTLAVGGFGVERSHRRAFPAKDRIELAQRSRRFSSARRRDLAATMRRTIEHTRSLARILEGVAETILWSTACHSCRR